MAAASTNPGAVRRKWKPPALRRRVFLSGAAALAASAPFVANSAVPNVGYISSGVKGTPLDTLFSEAMREGLAGQGYVVPTSLRWLSRYRGDGAVEVEALTQELIREGADVLIANGGATRAAVRSAAGKVPVIYGYSGDPVAAGLATSLAPPLYNATGISLMFVESNAKRIQIVKDLVPSMRRVALLSSLNHPGEASVAATYAPASTSFTAASISSKDACGTRSAKRLRFFFEITPRLSRQMMTSVAKSLPRRSICASTRRIT